MSQPSESQDEYHDQEHDEEPPYQPPWRAGGRQQKLVAPSLPLYKQHSWSPDIDRDEAWIRRKLGNKKKKKSRSMVTDEDIDELKACIELGFGFDSPELMDHRLSDTLPALGLFYAVNKHYYDHNNNNLCKSVVSADTVSSSSTPSDCDSPSSIGSPCGIFTPGESPKAMKTRLRQWAQVVACSVRQVPSST